MSDKNYENQHTFAICAYKESRFLEACILSLKNQSIPGNIILTTSTPNKFISDIAEKYKIKVFINKKRSGIAEDWNFAYKQVETPLVTIAHQDDIYEPKYLSELLEKINRSKYPLIYFTNYYEIRGEDKIFSNLLLNIKKNNVITFKNKETYFMYFYPAFNFIFWISNMLSFSYLCKG